LVLCIGDDGGNVDVVAVLLGVVVGVVVDG
jgi:hypothetical protein